MITYWAIAIKIVHISNQKRNILSSLLDTLLLSSSPLMAYSSNADNSKEVQLYPYPTHVNTANFLSIKLSGTRNYRSWQEQMICLLDSHDMSGFIDGTIKCNQGIKGDPKRKSDTLDKGWNVGKSDYKRKLQKTHIKAYWEWKRSDTLVKGWIFGSLTADVMDKVVGLNTSNQVWKRLKKNYDFSVAPTSTTISNQDSSKYRPLYEAIVNGDGMKAREYLIQDKDALTAKINDDGDSPLHVAIGACKNIHFVKILLEKIESESLPTLVCEKQQNPLHCAALVGNTMAAKMLVEKNPKLLFITDMKDLLPIHKAIFGGHVDTFKYLVKVTIKNIGLSQHQGHDNPFQGLNTATILNKLIGNGLFDVAYELINEYPDMAITKDGNTIPLKSIAKKLGAYLSGTKYNFYQSFVYHYVPIQDHNQDNARDIENQVPHATTLRRICFYSVTRKIYVKLWKVLLLHVEHVKGLHDDKVKHKKAALLLKRICKELQKIEKESELREHYLEAVLLALENDAIEAIEEIIKSFPQAIWTKQNGLNLIQLSIAHRCENVYSFLVHKAVTDKHVNKILTDKDGNSQMLTDRDGNNILHLAAQLAPLHKLNLVSGAALQMQWELQWFEKVKKFAHVNSKRKNKKEETPIMVFRREHKELRKEGEEWMKKTADSYTITAALIITIVFAAAITVPGGNDENTGKPIYATNPGFIVFVVSDAISLFTATTSLLLCLSILTTRFRDEDFLHRLPRRLMFVLGMLFLSVTCMTIAFSAALYIMFAQGKAWIWYPIVASTCVPIISFAKLQLPLLFDLFSSTYGHGIFGKQSDGKIKLH